MQYDEIVQFIVSHANPEAVAGMARYGINPANTYGMSVPDLRQLARRCGRDHVLAQQLWASGIHEARLLAGLVDDPALVGEAQLEAWAAEIDSWDVCDGCCNNLFVKTPWAYPKAAAWSSRPEEFVKRAGFVLMACLAVHDKKAADHAFLGFLVIIRREAADPRNFVKKAVNWALRQIGKRNLALNQAAVETALAIQQSEAKAARWVAADALRELTSDRIQQKLRC
jgi:3-methyladenine DNA glycosylase AlkD